MIYVIYGALGVLAVLALIVLGFVLGWHARKAWIKHTRKAAVEQASEEELRALKAEQRAFEGMLNYNTETAYGMVPNLEELAGGDE